MRNRFANKKSSLIFLVGGFTSVLTIMIWMIYNRVLFPYIEQSIIWASSSLGGAERPQLSISYLFDLSWILWTAFFIIGLFYFFQFRRRSSFLSNSKINNRFDLTIVILIFFIFIYFSRQGIPEKLTNHPFLFNYKYLLIHGSRKVLFSLDFAPVFIFILLVVINFYKSVVCKIILPNRYWVALAFGTSSLFQLYPIFDSYHCWFLSPILISSIFILADSVITANISSVISVLMVFVAVLSVQGLLDTHVYRYSFKNPTLVGMKSSQYWAPSVDKTFNLLDKYVTSKDVKYECGDGLYSVAHGVYSSLGADFVNWGPVNNQVAPKNIFACYIDELKISNYLANGWKIVFKQEYSHLVNGIIYKNYNVLLAKVDS